MIRPTTSEDRTREEDRIRKDALKIATFLQSERLFDNPAHILSVLGFISTEIIVKTYSEEEQLKVAKIMHEATKESIEANKTPTWRMQ